MGLEVLIDAPGGPVTAKTVLHNFIAGKAAEPADGRYEDLVDPATGEVFASAPVSGRADVDRAMEAASSAFEQWRDTTPSERQRALLKFADAVEARADELVAAESPEHRQAARADRQRGDAAGHRPDPVLRRRRAAARGPLRRASTCPATTSYVRREPIGVCAQVTPWNYPLMMAVWKLAPALAAGNTVVLKPSDTTPVTTILLAEIAAEFLPPGVLNVVTRRPGHRPRAGQPPDAADGVDHRFGAGRHGGRRGGRRRPQAHPPGAGRQGAGRGVRRRGHRGGRRRGIADGGLLQRRPGLHRRHPGAGRAAGLQRLRRRPDRAGPRHEDRRGRRRGRALRPAEQRPPARPGQRLPGPAARPRHPQRRRQPAGRPRLLLHPDRGLRPAAGRRDHPGRGVRPGHHRAAVHRRGRGGPLGQRRGVRPGLLGVDPRPRPGDADEPPAGLRLRLGQLPHPAGRGDAARRVQALRARQGPVGVRAGGLHPGQARHALPRASEHGADLRGTAQAPQHRGGPRRQLRRRPPMWTRRAAAGCATWTAGSGSTSAPASRSPASATPHPRVVEAVRGPGGAVHPHLLHGRAVRVVRRGL